MATITAKTFPGVYTQIIDQSFVAPIASRFKPGLIGVATKGPFDTPTPVRSLKEFVQLFGNPLTTTYNADGTPSGTGFFLADAVAIIADMTDGITIVRVGNRYTELDVANGSGVAGSYTFTTSVAQSVILNPVSPNQVFVSLTEAGKASTVNVQVISAGGGTVSLDPSGTALQANYSGAATISYSPFSGAATNAEGVIYAYTYGTSASGSIDVALTSFGSITGTKNQFQFDVQSNPSSIAVGDVYKITQTDKSTTHEVRVKQVLNNTVFLETSDLTRVGYQALPLQDNYDNGQLFKATGKIPFLYVEAATTGEWANGANSDQGVFVRVRPGSVPGTKKFEIFWDSGLVETFDNLSDDPSSADWFETRINDISQYISVKFAYSAGGGQLYQPANTAAPWDTSYYAANLAASPPSMPTGAINAGILTIPPSTTTDTGSQFTQGFNGENAQDSDFIGTIDPSDDSQTGIKAFDDPDNVDVNIIAAPMDDISISIEQELRRVAKKINALALADVPAGLSARQAIDWHNGTGVFTGRGKIDDYSLAIYWNWITITDPFTGLQKLVPPTLGALRCMAFTFDRDKPWYAAAGETRGLIPEAVAVEFDKVSQDVRQAMYGNGQSVNPILLLRNRILVYGERTMQRTESKLTAIHSVILVNFVVTGLAEIGRRFVFDPNDNELLVLIRLAFTEFLDKVRNERGIEDYELVVDERNNTPETRNRREVIIDLAIVPTDVAERIFINATVRESGAQLNSVQA
jgi:Phage tail sheath C-terminal domain